MLEKRSVHIERLAAKEEAVARQFVASEDELGRLPDDQSDPLMEDDHEAVRGLIHKYGNRVLCLLTAECAAYCRFCTRRRIVSDIERGRVGEGDIERWAEYISAHPEVKEIILSGGDPFVVSDELFALAVARLSAQRNIKLMRIGTRAPVSSPEMVSDAKLEAIRAVRQPVYVGVHFEHPAELTDETVEALNRLRKAGAILYSQTVFLADVNDNYDTLRELFTRLVEVGVRPYYIYRCDPVAGAGHFRVGFEKERRIMTALRRNLSGLACPTYVIDTPSGSGKIPVPLEFWDADTSAYRDFRGELHELNGLE
jgi:lysine 2,3-aminomutase